MSADWLDEQHERMKKQSWFRPDTKYGRPQAEKELKGKHAGFFVVRISSQAGHYAISAVRKNGTIDHMLILPSYAGAESKSPGKTQYRLGTYSKDLFNTIPKLIAYYIAHPYYENERLVGIVVPEDQAGGFYFDVKPVDTEQYLEVPE